MKLVRLTLENLRSYRDETIEFPEGTILVHGENGAGKTSLLMGVFGGLFLSDISYVGNYNLDDLITRGEKRARIELVFELGGVEYTVDWKFFRTSTPADATLSSPRFDTPVSGVRDVKNRLEEILGMSRKDFVSSVYVRQGEINRLIEGDERTELIDSLLNLDAIDTYITRVEGAKKAARDVQDHAEARREAAEEELQSIDHDADDLQRFLAQTEDEIADVEAEIEEVESFIDELEDQRDDRQSTLEGYRETKEKLAQREEKLEEKTEKRAEKLDEKTTANTKISDCSERIEALRSEIAELSDAVDYDLSTADAASEAASRVQREHTDAREAVATAEGDLNTATTKLERLESDRDETESDLEEARERVEEKEAALHEAERRVEDLEGGLETALDDRNSVAAEFLDTDPAEIDDQSRTDVDDAWLSKDEERQEAEKDLTRLEAEHDRLETDIEEAREELSDARERLEEAEKRYDEATDDVQEMETRVEELRSEFDAQVTALREATEPFDIDVDTDALPTLRDEALPTLRDETVQKINSHNKRIARLETTIDSLRSNIEEMEGLEGAAECPTCKQEVSPEHLEAERAELESELETAVGERDDARTEVEQLQERKSDIEDLLEDVKAVIAFRDEELATVEAELETTASERDEAERGVEEAKDRVESLSEEIDELETERAECQTDIDDVRERIEDLEREINEADRVLETFGEVELIREDLTDAQEAANDAAEELGDAEAEVEELVAKRGELREEIEAQREVVEERESALEAAKETASSIESAKKTIEEVDERYDEIDDLETEIEGHKQTITNAEETIEGLNSDISDLESQIERLQTELGETEPETLEEEIAQIESKIEEREETVDELESDLEELKERRIKLESGLESYRNQQAKADWFERQEEWARAVESELNTVLAAYRSSKSQLRQEYLGYLREYTNQIFDEVYRSGSYQQVVLREIEEKGEKVYDLKLLREDNELEDPVNASGGERAVVNLALRAGIYRLIAEIEGGDSGRLPPFILDEPTTFLDEGHVGKLERLLDTLRDWDVPQVLVVSHEESLKDGADHSCRVYYDPERGSSRAEMQRADETAPVADGGRVGNDLDTQGQGSDRKDDDGPRHN